MTPFLNTLLASISSAAPLFAGLVFVIRLIVRSENDKQLKELRNEILKQFDRIDAIYMKSLGANVTGAELVRISEVARAELEKLKTEITTETLYAHTKIHTINGELQRIQENLMNYFKK